MHQRETDVLANGEVAPDFVDVNLIVVAQPPRHVDHAGRDVEVKRGAQLPEVRPLRKRFQMVDRFACFNFDDRLKALATLERRQDEVGKQVRGAGADRDVLFGSWIDAGFETTPTLGLEEADDAVVFELFSNRSNEDRAHRT